MSSLKKTPHILLEDKTYLEKIQDKTFLDGKTTYQTMSTFSESSSAKALKHFATHCSLTMDVLQIRTDDFITGLGKSNQTLLKFLFLGSQEVTKIVHKSPEYHPLASPRGGI